MDLPETEEQPLVHEITSDEVNAERSLADQLRERRAEIAQAKEVFIPLTGYEQYNVTVKHRLVDRVEVERIGRRVIAETKDRGERNMRILIDTIIHSTLGFYVQPDGVEEPELIENPATHVGILGWDEFAHYLGLSNGDPSEEPNIRGALYWVFGSNEFAVGQYGIILNRWMGNTGLKVDEEFLGEML
jgi:hypothetical protein